MHPLLASVVRMDGSSHAFTHLIFDYKIVILQSTDQTNLLSFLNSVRGLTLHAKLGMCFLRNLQTYLTFLGCFIAFTALMFEGSGLQPSLNTI